jgi:uncharacterized membrane protein YbaN (DUF454 family)
MLATVGIIIRPIIKAPYILLSLYLFLKGKNVEEYMVLNMKMRNEKLGRIEN